MISEVERGLTLLRGVSVEQLYCTALPVRRGLSDERLVSGCAVTQ
jgi:hypothetical protein